MTVEEENVLLKSYLRSIQAILNNTNEKESVMLDKIYLIFIQDETLINLIKEQ